MLRWRLLLGALFIAALVALCWLDFHAPRPGVYLLPLALVVSLLGAGELLAMFRHRPREEQPLAASIYGGVLIAVGAAGMPALWPGSWQAGSPLGQLGWLAIGLAAGLLLAILGELRRFEMPGQATTNLALAGFAVLYLGGLMGFIIQLRLLGADSAVNRGKLGFLALVSLLLVVKLSDIGQYTVGRLLGKHKLLVTVSPGKTWEGVAGGMLFALSGGLATQWLGRQIGADAGYDFSGLLTKLTIAGSILYPISVAAAGIIGDLAESLLKRDAGVKDSSTWMPGFGGVLDLLDSLLGAAPVAYLFWAML